MADLDKVAQDFLYLTRVGDHGKNGQFLRQQRGQTNGSIWQILARNLAHAEWQADSGTVAEEC